MTIQAKGTHLGGRRVSFAEPDDGDVPTWDATAEEWVYGPPGGGATGDMEKAVYDTDDDGSVDEADLAHDVDDGIISLDKLTAAAAQVQVALGFGRQNPAASASAAIAGAYAGGGQYVVLPAGATLVGISAHFSGAFSAGSITFRARKNGSGDTGIELTCSAPTGGAATGTGVAFSSGDRAGVEYDTTGDYNGTTGVWVVVLWLKMDRV